MARSIISHFTSAIAGGAQYRKSTCLYECIDQKVFPDFIRLHEQPHLARAFGSGYFDKEGVATQNRELVIDGVVQNYIMGSYSARQLGLKSTANSGQETIRVARQVIGLRMVKFSMRLKKSPLLET